MTTREKLKTEFPEIYVSTLWEYDKEYGWDGDGPDPQDEGYFEELAREAIGNLG